MKPLQFIAHAPLFLSFVTLFISSCASTPSETPLPEPPLEPSSSPSSLSQPAVSSENPTSRISGNWAFDRSEGTDISRLEPGAPDPVQLLNQNLAGTKITVHEDGSSTFTSGSVTEEFTFTVTNETPEAIHFNVIGATHTQVFIYEKARDRLVQPVNVRINQTTGSINSYYTRSR